METFYCVKGRHKVKISDYVKVKVGRRKAIKGRCPVHKNWMFRFVG